MRQFIYQVFCKSYITGEGTAEILRAWGAGFEQEGAGGGGDSNCARKLQIKGQNLYTHICCITTIVYYIQLIVHTVPASKLTNYIWEIDSSIAHAR